MVVDRNVHFDLLHPEWKPTVILGYVMHKHVVPFWIKVKWSLRHKRSDHGLCEPTSNCAADGEVS